MVQTGTHQVLTLQPLLAESARVRAYLGEIADQLGFSQERSFDIRVAVGEAIANAIEHAHGAGEVQVEIKVLADRLEVSVRGPGEFHLPAQGNGREHRGLGLPLMAKLSDHLALYSAEKGTLVTLTFYVPGATPGPSTLPPALTELIAENTLLNDIFNNLPDGFMVCDREWRFLYVNNKLAERAGMPREELIGRNLWDQFPIKDLQARAAVEAASSAGRSARVTAHSDGNGLWRELSVFPVSEGTAIVSRDIGQQKRAESALKKSEERFRATFEQAAVGIAHVGLDGRFLRVNHRYAAILGYKPDDLCRLTMQQLSQHEDLLAEMRNRDRLMRGEIPYYSMDKRFVREDGSVVRVRLTVSLVGDPESQEAYFVSVIEDISRRTELASQLDAVLEAIADAVVLYDEHGEPVKANLTARETYGLVQPKREALRDVRMTDETGRPVRLEQLPSSRALRGEEVRDETYHLSTLYGERRTLLISASPVKLGGKSFGAVTIGRDITRLEQTQQELRDAYSKLETVLNAVSDGFFAFDSEFRIRYMGRLSADQIRNAGIDPESLNGRVPWEVVPELLTTEAQAKLREAMRSRRPVVDEMESMGRWWEMRAYPLPDGGLAVLFPDITERKRLDQERESYLNELTETTRLNEALLRINRSISSALDPETMLDTALKEVVRAVGGDNGAINMREGDVWVVRHSYGFAEEVRGRRFVDREGPFASLPMGSHEPVIVQDVDHDSRVNLELMRRYGIKSAIAVPLVVRGRAIGGVLANRTRSAAPFSRGQVDFARRAGTSISLALESAMYFQREREAHALADVLNDINRTITSSQEAGEILQRVTEEAATAVHAEAAVVEMRAPGGWEVRHVFGLPERMLGRRLSEWDAPIAEVAAGMDEPLVLEDTQKDSRFLGLLQKSYIHSLMAAALRVKGHAVGVLIVLNSRKQVPFSAIDVDFMKKLGISVSLALESARLYEALTEDDRLAKALVRLTQAIAASSDQEEMLNRVVVDGLDAMRADGSGVCLPTGDVWTVVNAAGRATQFLGHKIPVAQVPLAFFSGGLARISDMKDPALSGIIPEEMRVLGAKAFIIIPLMTRGELNGVLFFSRYSAPADFSPAQLDFAENLATSVSLALENARLYGAQKTIADTLQEALLWRPRRMVGLQVDSSYHSASETAFVGGDFFDVFDINQEVAGLVIGDVCGHGVEAARLAAFVRDALRAYAFQELPVARVMALCNRALVRETELSGFTTVFFATLNKRTGDLVYCSAGHPPAMVRRGKGEVEVLSRASGLPLGAFPGTEYEVGRERLSGDDLLLLYTDGVIEARQHRLLFGEDRLAGIIGAHGASIHGLVQAILSAVISFSAGHLPDDLALVAVQRQGPA